MEHCKYWQAPYMYRNGTLQVLASPLHVPEWNTASAGRPLTCTGMEHCKCWQAPYMYRNGTLQVLAGPLHVPEWNTASAGRPLTCIQKLRENLNFRFHEKINSTCIKFTQNLFLKRLRKRVKIAFFNDIPN
jgi:hypothetical protein